MLGKLLRNRFSRRSFLVGVGATSALPIVAACQPQVLEVERVQVVEKEVPVERIVTQIIDRPVERIITVEVERAVEVERIVTVEVDRPVEVEVERIVERSVERIVTVEVEKAVIIEREVEVEVEVEVEKEVIREVVIEPTEIPIRKVGPDLLHPTPEGGKVILDVSKYPTTFGESPIFAKEVAAGNLPPVNERLPVREDLLVVDPVFEIGKYGGTIRRGFTSAGDRQNLGRFAAHDMFTYWDFAVENLIPNVAKGWELSDDWTTINLLLRRGMRWSDGAPVTADDIMFWYDYIYNNEQLMRIKPIQMFVTGEGGEQIEGTITKIDDFTVQYKFAGPYASFPEQLGVLNAITGPSETWGPRGASGGIAPAHYLKQFHADFADPADLDALVRAHKVDDWVALFRIKNDWYLNPDWPCFTAYKTVSPINRSTWVVERNPYFYQVDIAGNQLPYNDRIVLTLVENIEVMNLRAIAGEYDYADRHIQLSKLPVFLQNETRGDYKVWLDPGSYGSIAGVIFNNSYDADDEISKWILNIDFRKALSMGMDRDQINEAFFAGLGTPGSGVPLPTNPFYPGDQYRDVPWVQYNPDEANRVLDELGLDKKDADGYRLRTDGGGRLHFWAPCQQAAHLPICEIAEFIGQQWKKIGISFEGRPMPGPEVQALTENNEVIATIWENNSSEVMFEQAGNYIPVNFPNPLGPAIARWFDTGGAEGQPPPGHMGMERVVELWRKGRTIPREMRVPLGKEIWTYLVDNLYHITTVGFVPVILGMHIVKNKMGNIQRRTAVSSSGQTPGNARPETYFWKEF